jgi:hypothetical protein
LFVFRAAVVQSLRRASGPGRRPGPLTCRGSCSPDSPPGARLSRPYHKTRRHEPGARRPGPVRQGHPAHHHPSRPITGHHRGRARHGPGTRGPGSCVRTPPGRGHMSHCHRIRRVTGQPSETEGGLRVSATPVPPHQQPFRRRPEPMSEINVHKQPCRWVVRGQCMGHLLGSTLACAPLLGLPQQTGLDLRAVGLGAVGNKNRDTPP